MADLNRFMSFMRTSFMPWRHLMAGPLLVVFVIVFAGPLASQEKKKPDLENFIFLQTDYGRSIIQLYPDKAPQHVEQVRKLVRAGFYDGLTFHRVIHGFMAQTGDPTGTGSGGSELPDLKAEFNDIPFNRGVIGAARTQNTNSANSQFFICFQATHPLNGQYTAWGKVVKGMEYIDQIKRGQGYSGVVAEPDKIISMKLAADVPGDHTMLLLPFTPGFEMQMRQKVLPKIE